MKHLIFFVAFVVSIPLLARTEFISLQEKAQGQSLTGGNVLNDSLYSNPAGSAFTSAYSVEAIYGLPRSFAVSILDTKTSDIGGALGYFRNPLADGSGTVQGAKLALTKRLGNYVGVGLAGKMFWGTGTKLTDLDVGVLADFQVVQAGFSIRNILGGRQELSEVRQWSLGGRINYENTVFFSATSQSNWSRFAPVQYGLGAEYVSPYFFSLKGGFRIRPSESLSYWSAGASFVSPKLALHYVVEIPNQATAEVEHVFGATLLF